MLSVKNSLQIYNNISRLKVKGWNKIYDENVKAKQEWLY